MAWHGPGQGAHPDAFADLQRGSEQATPTERPAAGPQASRDGSVRDGDAADGPGTDPDRGQRAGALPPLVSAPAPHVGPETISEVLSHELRTPITTIYGSSKVLGRLEGRLSDEARREVYRDIEAEAERLYRLVEDLLVLARFGEAPVRLGDEPVLLQRLLPGVIASEQARSPRTRFRAEIPPGLPTVRAEPTYVEQVARNLLANAAKYGPPEGTVSLRLEAAPGEVVCRVADEGPGFPTEEGPRLFELFYRSPGTSATVGGAGIGLFVCRRLIEGMGGRIWAVNRPESGAEFGFALPAFAEDEP